MSGRKPYDDHAARPLIELPPRESYTSLLAALEREPAPRRRWAPRPASIIVALPLLTLAAIALDALLRQRTLIRSDVPNVIHVWLPSVVGFCVVAFMTTRVALSSGKLGLGEGISCLSCAALCVAPLSATSMLLIVRHGAPLAAQREYLDPWGVPCFLMTSALAATCLTLLARCLRGSVPVASGWRSAALGSAAAAWPGLALLIHCPGIDAQHLLFGHLLPIILAPMFGLLFVKPIVKL